MPNTTLNPMIRLVGGGVCPEQYEAFDIDNKRVGYIRYRHGRLTVECPDIGGELIYERILDVKREKGEFDEDARPWWLHEALAAIEDWIEAEEEKAEAPALLLHGNEAENV